MEKINNQIEREIIEYCCQGKSYKFIKEKTGLNKDLVRKFMKDKFPNFKKGNRKYDVDIHFFDSIDTEEKAYVLGFIFGDGHNNTNAGSLTINIQEQDLDILKKIKEVLKYTGPIKLQKGRSKLGFNTKDYWKLEIGNRFISNRLTELGVNKNKTYNIEYPKNIIENNFLRHFIRGLLDSDGCITMNKNNMKNVRSYICGRRDLILPIFNFVEKETGLKFYNFPLSKKYNDESFSIYGFSGCNKVKVFLDWIYKDATIYLDRKYKKYEAINSHINSRVNKCTYNWITNHGKAQ